MDRSRITVHVVDDEPAVLDSLKALLGSVRLRSRTHLTAQSFLDSYDPAEPGCLVLDVRLPDLSGLELQERLHERGAPIPVILITGNGDIPMAVRGMRGGAIDFLEKPFNAQVLLERVEQALRVDATTRQADAARATDARRLGLLTTRERQVAEMVTDGYANKEIARLLTLSQKTVELHRAKAMHKLQARHVADMIALMLRARAASDSGD